MTRAEIKFTTPSPSRTTSTIRRTGACSCSAALIALALASCEPGRAPARTALDGYRRAVAETCACRAPACVATAETSWLEVGREADRAHARFSGNEDIWLVQLELQYQQCRARALGHRGDYDQLGITSGGRTFDR